MIAGTIATAAMFASAAPASAPAIAVNGACFINAQPNQGAPITVSGSGFNPGATVLLSGAIVGMVPVSTSGTFAVNTNGPTLGFSGPGSSQFTVNARDQSSTIVAATATFSVANLAFRTSPATASPTKRVRFTFSGFKPDALLYGHYVFHGKVAKTVRFGRTKGSCGLLNAPGHLFPGGHPRYGTYKVQFDNSSKYRAKTVPRIVSGLTIRPSPTPTL